MDVTLGMWLLVYALAAAVVPPIDGAHVRTDDPDVRATIDTGMLRSPLFRELVARVDASDVIVYATNDCSMPQFLFGKTTFMSSGGGRRYVMIGIACGHPERERVAILGHELQHVMEIADAPSIVDQVTLAAYYQRIGFMSDGFTPGKGFDTGAAIETGRRVWAELGKSAAE